MIGNYDAHLSSEQVLTLRYNQPHHAVTCSCSLRQNNLLGVHEGCGAGAAVHTVVVGSHEDAWATLGAGLPGAVHLARVINAVVLEYTQLDVLVRVLVLLGLGVGLLLALLTSTEQTTEHIEAAALLDAALRQESVSLELLTTEDDAGSIGWEACMLPAVRRSGKALQSQAKPCVFARRFGCNNHSV